MYVEANQDGSAIILTVEMLMAVSNLSMATLSRRQYYQTLRCMLEFAIG